MSAAKKTDPAVSIRFPKPLLKAVKSAAKQSGRSQNSEVVIRLMSSFGMADAGQPQKAEPAA